MKTYLDCIPCYLRQALAAARASTDDENLHRRVLDEVASMVIDFRMDITPPEIAQKVYRVVYSVTGNYDPYRETKHLSNQRVLELYPELKKRIDCSDDPLIAACKLAIAGNSIDLAPYVRQDNLEKTIESIMGSPLKLNDYGYFCQSLGKADTILYLADNAGEIVFDKLLIEELCRYDNKKVTVVVRESPIINDATVIDAREAGLYEIVDVVPSGSDAPATIIDQCSDEVRELFNTSDMIVSKGQGNYESLSDVEANIYFLFQSKCPVVAEPLKVIVGDGILKRGEIWQ